ncbi:YjbQ family protein [Pseudolactococcus yaeyamensis]
MTIKHGQIKVASNGRRVTYTNITDDVKKFIKESGIKDGMLLISSQHTTCSVVFEEFVHDLDWNGDELLQVDLNRILDQLIPPQLTESDYLYPGQKHVDFLYDLAKVDPSFPTDPATILNADAHLRASMFGSNESVIIKDGKALIGSVGYLYFIDWDRNRVRTRTCNLMIMGE